jgi:hypothetical protein
MLKIIRRVFSFSDWSRTHPRDPVPGDMLDAQFDEIIDRVDVWDERIRKVVTDEGRVGAGVVGIHALDDNFRAFLDQKLADSVEKLRFELSEYAKSAISAEKTTLAASLDAIRAAASAKIAESAVSEAQNRAAAQFAAVEARSAAVSAAADQFLASQATITAGTGESEAWAVASALWAEHMPDTLPDNALKIMDVTGDHWSSRWWANKAAGAFGAMSSLYLGAHPVPPSTTNTGDPIPLGAIYYNTETGQMYVWDGSQWVSMTQPQRAGLAALWYNAADGQTAFPFATMDLNGRNYALSIDATEGVDAHVNGIKLMPKETGTEGDWTLNNATSTVTFLRPLRLGDIVSFDILMANSKLGPGQVYVWALKKAEAQDGVRTTFTLSTKAAGGPAVTISKNEELLVSLDGVVQEPAVSYSATGATITFAQAPAADAYIFFTWFRPGA